MLSAAGTSLAAYRTGRMTEQICAWMRAIRQ
jgi:hypothetical protein